MMKLKALALAAAVSAAPAFADTVKLDGFTFAPGLNLNVTAPNYNGDAGQFSGWLDGNSFATFCTDLSQTFNFGTTCADDSIVSGVSAWGATKALDLDRAFPNFAAFSHPANNVESATIPAMVREILYETAGNPYALLLAGQARIGFVARRRTRAA